jgi:uncharacterized protein YecT (DUF1311 family)
MGGFCAFIRERQDEKERSYRLTEYRSKLTPPQKEIFDKLQITVREFAKLRGDKETDQMGSARSELVIEAQAAEMDTFESDLSDFGKGNTPHFADKQFGDLDKNLNHIYQEIMHAKVDDNSRLGFTTITKEDVKISQRAWLKYRDAWVSFGHVTYTSVDPISWKAFFTERRIKQLSELLEEAK